MNNSTCEEKKHQTKRQEQVFFSLVIISSRINRHFICNFLQCLNCPFLFMSRVSRERETQSFWLTNFLWRMKDLWEKKIKTTYTEYTEWLCNLLCFSSLSSSCFKLSNKFVSWSLWQLYSLWCFLLSSFSFPGTDLKMQWTWKVVSGKKERWVWKRKSSLRPPSPQDFPPESFSWVTLLNCNSHLLFAVCDDAALNASTTSMHLHWRRRWEKGWYPVSFTLTKQSTFDWSVSSGYEMRVRC